MLEVFQDIEQEEEAETRIPEEYEVDFNTMKLTGRKVSGNEALKIWCFFALKTERYRYRAFSWEYGSEFEEMIGTNFGRDFQESEIKRRIAETLCVHPYISDVGNFEVSFQNQRLLVSCRVETDFGSFELSTDITEDIYV